MSAKMRSRAICLLAIAVTSLRAEDRAMDLQGLLARLVENNPEIQAARFRFEAATKRPSQAGTLPEPTARYTNFGVGHPFSPLNATEFAYHGFGVSQEFPFPGHLKQPGSVCQDGFPASMYQRRPFEKHRFAKGFKRVSKDQKRITPKLS